MYLQRIHAKYTITKKEIGQNLFKQTLSLNNKDWSDALQLDQ